MWKMVLVTLVLCQSLNAVDPVETTEPELCGAEQTVCEPKSCLQACINDGEDPMDCPYYCYDQV